MKGLLEGKMFNEVYLSTENLEDFRAEDGNIRPSGILTWRLAGL